MNPSIKSSPKKRNVKFQCNSVASNLSSIDGAQQAGVLTQSKNLSDSDEIYLINQSVTGFFEKKVRLAPYKEE